MIKSQAKRRIVCRPLIRKMHHVKITAITAWGWDRNLAKKRDLEKEKAAMRADRLPLGTRCEKMKTLKRHRSSNRNTVLFFNCDFFSHLKKS